MKIGGHVSAAGGVDQAIERALAIGANCFQIFVTSPRTWRKNIYSDDQITRFVEGINKNNLKPVFIHALYLANLATSNDELLEKSIDALAHALKMADRLEIQGVIYHTGSKRDRSEDEAMAQVVRAMKDVLKLSPGQSQLIVEGAAGQGGALGSTFDELGQMVKGAGSDRVKVCLDTCHLFAAGFDLRTEEGVAKTLAEFDQKVGLNNLVVIHANDSKFGLGKGKDRHENIGQGEIGDAGFKSLVNNSSLEKLPWILEVPGFGDKKGPDKDNIDKLKSLHEQR